MKMNKKNNKSGFSLVDALVAVVMIIIIVLGATMYRYYSTLEVRKAQEQLKASRLAVTLCETWRAASGSAGYDPSDHLGSDNVSFSGQGASKPSGYILQNNYEIAFDDLDCKATLSYKDESSDLRALNIIVAWPNGNAGQDKEFEINSYCAF